MDVARLNFSHGSHQDHAASYQLVREASDATGHSVGILADLQGPKIRERQGPDLCVCDDGRMDEPDDASDLYRLDPSTFTAARDVLARKLRDAGERSEADRVRKLRRPPVTAWALNQVARWEPDLIAAVLDASAALKAATERAATGDGSAIRATKMAERRAVDAAVSAALEALQLAGHPSGDKVQRRMAETLRAAALRDEVADELRSGTLRQDYSTPGFGFDVAALDVGAPAGEEPGLPVDGETEAAAASAAAAARREEAKVRHAALSAEADRLRQVAEQLASEAQAAHERADQARAAADDAARVALAALSVLGAPET